MKKIFKIIRIVLALFAISVINIFVINFFPFPYDRINVIFLYLFGIVIVRPEENGVLWQGMALSYISELYSDSAFGINMLSCVGALLVAQSLLKNIFTNRSSPIVFFVSVTGILSYRAIYFILLSASDFFNHSLISVNISSLAGAVYESLLTSGLLFIAYFVGSRFSRKFDPNYLSAGRKES